jgi:hypothetical protein
MLNFSLLGNGHYHVLIPHLNCFQPAKEHRPEFSFVAQPASDRPGRDIFTLASWLFQVEGIKSFLQKNT